MKQILDANGIATPNEILTGEEGVSRRRFVAGGVSVMGAALAGCTTNTLSLGPTAPIVTDERLLHMSLYPTLTDEKFTVPGIPYGFLEPKFFRQRVEDPTGEKPGTIVVNTETFFLHLVEDDGTAMRYGVGLGRAGFEWAGRARIARKAQWPTWTPPAEMIEREPDLEKWSAKNGGMKPGIDNPLGARALYIFQDGRDTLYRIHGNPDYTSIGKAVSSGCVRLINQDAIDLYGRVKRGAKIVVKSTAA